MDAQYNKTSNQQKDIYVINLDLTRVFWLIAIGLFFITSFFLVGYWLGSDTNYNEQMEGYSKKSSRNKLISLKDKDIKKFANLQEVKEITENALINKRHVKSSNNVEDDENNEQNDNSEIDANVNKSKHLKQPTTRQNELTNSHDSRISKKLPYTIQVSTHKQGTNARKLRNSLIKKGFPAYIFIKRNQRDSLYYFVRIGPYPSERKAQEIQQKVRNIKEGKTCIVVNH
ncbi:MAG: SPOR domain-containing protein [Spirochaetota bacterium]|nr:SPOR domain-containing protein [Spirochaetota bacterium]